VSIDTNTILDAAPLPETLAHLLRRQI